MLEEAGLYGTRFVMESAYTSMVQAKDAEIVRLNGQIAEFNRWLSKGVYFTTEEYQQRVEQHNAEIAALTSRLAESEKAAYDVVGTIDHLKDANARLRECLVKCKRELFWCDKQLVTKGFTTGFSKTTASVKEVLEAAQHALADTDTKTERPAERGMMSKPRTTYDDAMRGVTFELIGAMSSLNMEPETMKESTGSFLSESDTWASHAVEHIRAAIQLARKAEADNAALREQLETLKKQLPDEMQDCTIVFKECEQGHGRLIAANWIDHGCGTCALESLQAQLVDRDAMILQMGEQAAVLAKENMAVKTQLRQVEGERDEAIECASRPTWVCDGCGRVSQDGWVDRVIELMDGTEYCMECPVCGVRDIEEDCASDLAQERDDLQDALTTLRAQLRQVEGELADEKTAYKKLSEQWNKDSLDLQAKDAEIAACEEAIANMEKQMTEERVWLEQTNKTNEALTNTNARLREALDKLARLGNEPYYGNSTGNVIAQQALAATDVKENI